ncbi:hypothetical protein BVRB_3g049270 [Beta vulgaris subsp. vulgaris]|nr:hypothetical protein BVRB_3g049270 [Beta vulgaris subsp. vulgaris]
MCLHWVSMVSRLYRFYQHYITDKTRMDMGTQFAT